MRIGGAVLAGGASSRMGRPKARLSINGESFLDRAVQVLASVVDECIVVAAANRAFTTTVRVVVDTVAGRGPLQGLHDAFMALPDCDVIFVLAVDMPRMTPDVLETIIDASRELDKARPSLNISYSPPLTSAGLGEGSSGHAPLEIRGVDMAQSLAIVSGLTLPQPLPAKPGRGERSETANATAHVDAVIPRIQGRAQPLAAIYRRSALPVLERQLQSSDRSMSAFLEGLRVLWLDECDVGAFDNVNTPEDYANLGSA